MKKKLLSLFLVVCMVFQISIIANAEEESQSSNAADAYAYLSSIGTPEDILSTYSEERMIFLYEQLEGTESEYAGFKSEVMEFSEPQKERGAITPGSLTFGTSYFNTYVKGTIRVEQTTVSLGYKWNKLPFFRGEDALTLNWDSSLFYNSGLFYACGAGEVQGIGYKIFNETTQPALSNVGGIGWYVNLYPGGYAQTVTLLSGEATLILSPKITMYKGNSYRGNITSTYGHKSLSFSGGLSLSGASVGISSGNIDYQSSTLVYAP